MPFLLPSPFLLLLLLVSAYLDIGKVTVEVRLRRCIITSRSLRNRRFSIWEGSRHQPKPIVASLDPGYTQHTKSIILRADQAQLRVDWERGRGMVDQTAGKGNLSGWSGRHRATRDLSAAGLSRSCLHLP